MDISKLQVATGIVAAVTIGSTAAYATHVFDDVEDGAFYADPVEWAATNEITTGKTPDLFAPLDPVTRGESVTFLRRYDTNIVQPALADVQEGLANAEAAVAGNAADIDATETATTTNATDIADLRAAAMLHGEIVQIHATADMQPLIVNAPSALTYFINGTGISDGAAVKSLSGPSSINGVAYELHELEYCMNAPTGDGWATAIEVWGPSGQLVLDETDRLVEGCWSYTLDVAADGAFTFALEADDVVGGAVRVVSITTTWRPA